MKRTYDWYRKSVDHPYATNHVQDANRKNNAVKRQIENQRNPYRTRVWRSDAKPA